jgi:hypothetical protein
MFITLFTRARHLSLSWARFFVSTASHPISLTSIIILSSHLLPGLPSDLFPSRFQTNILYAFLFSPICVTCPVHLILLDFITLMMSGEVCKLWSSSLCGLLQSPATYSLPLLGPCTFFNTCTNMTSTLHEAEFEFLSLKRRLIEQQIGTIHKV